MSRNASEADALAEQLRSLSSISGDDLVSWMNVSNIETLGVLYDAISDPAIVQRVRPGLSTAQAQDFLRRYFGRCLLENPQGEWADSRYTAAWDAARWLKASWTSLHDSERLQWKEWLTDLYRHSDATVRESLETGLLEHIFSDRQIARYFIDWEQSPDLREAYSTTLAVAQGVLGRRLR